MYIQYYWTGKFHNKKMLLLISSYPLILPVKWVHLIYTSLIASEVKKCVHFVQ